MPAPARLTLPLPPIFPPFPRWARACAPPRDPSEASFLAGAALAAIHPIARNDHPLGGLWRQRLALANAAVLARHAGRTEDEASLRDAWYLRRDDHDPGPAGRILRSWRRLGEPAALRPADWIGLAAALELRVDQAFHDIVTLATHSQRESGRRWRRRPRSPRSVSDCGRTPRRWRWWLADAVLAHRLTWPAPVPLLAGTVRRVDLRAAAHHVEGDHAWPTACNLAYAQAAAAASDLYAELGRRAAKLAAVAPQLRAKDADRMVAILLREDAQPAAAGTQASDRSGRRLVERLVSLGAVRELTGRAAFRLYGL